MKINFNSYKEKNISNVSREDTTIIKYLDKRQTVSHCVALIMVCVIITDVIYHDQLGHILATMIMIVATIVMIAFIINDMLISRKQSMVKKWQKEELYRSIKNKEETQ